jgi:hypothetical protein
MGAAAPRGGARGLKELKRLLITESGNDARLFDRVAGRPGITPEIPQVEDTEIRGLFFFCQFNIRRYRFAYFRYQSFEDVILQLHTGVHNVTFHNYLFLLINCLIRATG